MRLISLAKADRLFRERAALQQRYVALRQSGSRQRSRQLEQDFRANTREPPGAALQRAPSAEIASTSGSPLPLSAYVGTRAATGDRHRPARRRLVREVYERPFEVIEKSHDNPLTEADLRANERIHAAVVAAFPTTPAVG